MRNPRDLTKDQLVHIIQDIRDWLWLDVDEDRERYNPDRNWDADICDEIGKILQRADLAPKKILPFGAGYPKRTSDQLWKDDNIQFPRLLDEIRAHGVPTNMMSDLESSMDLKAHQIEELFARATKRFEETKIDET